MQVPSDADRGLSNTKQHIVEWWSTAHMGPIGCGGMWHMRAHGLL